MRMILMTRRGAAMTLTVAVLASCGDGSSGDEGAGPAGIVATTTIWADVTSETLCGLAVPAVIPAGADPHTFEASLRDRELLEDSDLVIANGGDLEESLTDILSTVSASGTDVVELVPLVDTIDGGHDDHDGHDGHDGHDDHDDHDDHGDHGDHDAGGADGDDGSEDADHDADHNGSEDADHDGDHDHHDGVDPHIWQDPTRVAGVLDAIAQAGTATEGDPATCVPAYRAELERLDADIAALIDEIPAADRLMVTSHDSLAYFADRYGLEVVGTVIPSTNTLAQTNAADLADLADLIEERGVRAIFTEELESTADADALAARLGVLVVPLVTDALTTDPETDTYVEMMRVNATRIAEALTP